MVGAVAREVVEANLDSVMSHPVGTGPFKLVRWNRSSLIVLDKNPGYREQYYDEEAPADDPIAQAAVAKLKGRRLPLVDRVEVSDHRGGAAALALLPQCRDGRRRAGA